MQDDEEYGVEEVINQLAPVKDITASVFNEIIFFFLKIFQ